MNINHIYDIYQVTRGVLLAGMVRLNPKTAMKTTIKIFSVTAMIMAFLFGVGAEVALAQAVNAGVTCNSAVLQGSVNINPVGTPTNVWFEWGTNTNFTNTSAVQVLTSSGNVSQALTGLSQNTTYYYRTVAQNTFGLVRGATSNFITPFCSGATTVTGTEQVTVATNNASFVSANSVVLNGWIDPHGVNNTNAWFEWGTSSVSPLGNNTASVNYGITQSSVSATIGSLSSDVTYYYRIVAQNANGISYGQIYRFSTGNYSSNGTYYGYGSTGVDLVGYGLNGWTGLVPPPGGNSISYANSNTYSTASCLNCNYGPATYTGSSWGNQPVVNTYSSNVSNNYAVLNGYVNPNGNSNVVRWFEWGTNQYFLSNFTSRISQTSSGTFSDNISNLAINTTYYYRAAATGLSGTTYGQTLSFTTGGIIGSNYINTASYSYGYTNNYTSSPGTSVVTNSPLSLGDTVVKLSGTVVLSNNNSQTNIWFEWGTTNYLGNVTPTKMAGSNPSVIFDETLNGLSSNVTYYYRAVAQNQYGIFRGDILTFRTFSQAPAVTYVPYNQTQNYTNYQTQPNVNYNYRTVTLGTGASKTALMKVSMSSDSDRICRGDFEVFTVDYTNTSSQTLKDVVLRVELPTELKYQDSSKGYFSDKNNTLVVDMGTFSPDESGQVVVKATAVANSSTGGEIVTTAKAVYTTPSGSQGEVVSYVIGKSECVSPNVALSLFGTNFLPDTFLGWLILIIIILALVVLSRHLYGSYSVKK